MLASLQATKLGDLQMTMVRVKIDHERKDASNVVKRDICLENVQMEIVNNLERKVVSSVEKKGICHENVLMVIINSQEKVDASSAEEKGIEQETVQESKLLMLNLKMKKDLEEEVASSVEETDTEQEIAQEKNSLSKKKDHEEEERMKTQT